jgi:putative ATPase
MKDLGYGKDYKYAHNYRGAVVAQEYLPDKLKGQHFYLPTSRGFEKIIKERLDKWRQLIQKSKARKDKVD